MNTRTLRTLALVMVSLAVLLGLYAYRLSQRRAITVVAGQQSDTVPFKGKVVVALKLIEAGQSVQPNAISLEPVTVVPQESFGQVEEVIGKELLAPVAMGEPLTARHFRSRSPLALTLHPGERAVAVQVDGVVGAGGFVQPGDYVDVLLYLRDDKETQNTQSRILLRCLRVLTFGNKLKGQREEKPTLDARTAVLAVQELAMTKLMLGASAGRLRLALLHSEMCRQEAEIAKANGVNRDVAQTHQPQKVTNVAAKPTEKQGTAVAKTQEEKLQEEMIITLRQLSALRNSAEPQVRRKAAPVRQPPKARTVIYRGTEKETVVH
jgi:pilus assembly protein CpaB